MPIFTDHLPLSIYVHIPWCIQKCPYCDFNSHAVKYSLPEEIYVSALLQELDSRLYLIENRPIVSIFFGGGTPSLFSPLAIKRILDGISQRILLTPQIEITLEANPGTIDQAYFRDFYHAGINRLSLGVQSLQNEKLKRLGRIHDRANVFQAINIAKEAGFNNFNLDLMYGLPNQTLDEALCDLQTALTFEPTHLSWYQLTIEPNTLFYRQPPVLPADDSIWQMQIAGQHLLEKSGFQQYEVSAYSRPNKQCIHNLNYWNFSDYLGIGAGAHSKITNFKTGEVIRFAQVRHPKDYLDASKRQIINSHLLQEKDLIFEFMLNALRLTHGIPATLFTQRTGLSLQRIQSILAIAVQKGLMDNNPNHLQPSTMGMKFLNDLTALFL